MIRRSSHCAWHEPLDLHGVQSEIRGDYAFPMSARGILVGALVVQTKKSGESYATDELDALKTLAHGTGFRARFARAFTERIRRRNLRGGPEFGGFDPKLGRDRSALAK